MVYNPFDDIKPRNLRAVPEKKQEVTVVQKGVKWVYNLNVNASLSLFEFIV